MATKNSEQPSLEHPAVFISYSWTSQDYQARVIDLATRLSSDGVRVIIDKWDLKEGQDKYAFMERMVTDGDVSKVLMLCDREYAAKADGRLGGVGTESQIVSSEIYDKVDQEKFVPVVMERDSDRKEFLPTFLKSRIYIDIHSDEVFASGYDQILRSVYGLPLHERPSIGDKPLHLVSTDPDRLVGQAKLHRVFNQGEVSVGALEDYLTEFTESLWDFSIQSNDRDHWDDIVVQSIRELRPTRDQFVAMVDSLLEKGPPDRSIEILFEFYERLLRFRYAPESQGSFNEVWFDNFRFFNREMFPYFIGTLVKRRRYEIADHFLAETYFFETRYESKRGRFDEFDQHVPSLDRVRNKRLQLRRVSVTADTVMARVEGGLLTSKEVMQTDLILSARAFLDQEKAGIRWFPITLVYHEELGGKDFDLFLRAQSPTRFSPIGTLLNVRDREELITRYQEAEERHALSQWRFDYWPISFHQLMCL